MRNMYKMLVGKPVKQILEKQGVKVWTGFIWLRIQPTGGLLLLNMVTNVWIL
jgi:hypothetical protein